MKRILVTLAATIVAAATAGMVHARDLKFTSPLTQSEFRDFSKEAGSALSYHNTAPSVTLGITGFEVAAQAVTVNVPQKASYWANAFGTDAPDFLVIPSLRARKGLPFGIDVGALYSYIPDSNIKLYGVELSKAILNGGIITPTLGVRGSWSKLAGVDDLDLQTFAADVNLSKGFVIATPYIGAGVVRIESKPKGNLLSLSPSLSDESITQSRYFGGVKLSILPLVSLTGEVEYAQRATYSLKASVGF
ncbi:MAG: hypothetical protein Fur0034_07500 [Desulfuromonadia bacterium]